MHQRQRVGEPGEPNRSKEAMREMDDETDIGGALQQRECCTLDLPPIGWLGGGEGITLLTLGLAARRRLERYIGRIVSKMLPAGGIFRDRRQQPLEVEHGHFPTSACFQSPFNTLH